MEEYFKVYDKHQDPLSYTAIRISLASPDLIEKWSYGEVKKPETPTRRDPATRSGGWDPP